MGDKSTIEWTDATWNPVTGCSKVSPGCDNCYAIKTADWIQGMGGKGALAYEGTTDGQGDWTGKLNLLPQRLDHPLRWKKPRHIFVNSMSDLFHPDVPLDFIIEEVWPVMEEADHHVFQVLTKRPQRMAQVGKMILDGGHKIPEHIWLGTSIESNKYTFRADHLRDTPAKVRWLSLEPLLGPLPDLDLTGIDWVVAGGESGPGARPMHPDWVRDIRDRCVDKGVAFHFKQWGEWVEFDPNDELEFSDEDNRRAGHRFMNNTDGTSADYCTGGVYMNRIGKKRAGRSLDGRTWDEWPNQTFAMT